MSGDEEPTTARATTTLEVPAPQHDDDDDAPIARPAHWVSSLLWLILVATCALVAIGSAGALILDFLAGSLDQSGAKETILLIFSTSFNGLIALFVTRPGTR